MKYLKVIIILLLIIACQGKKETIKTEEKSSLQVPKLDTVVLNNDTMSSEKKVDSIKEEILEPLVPSRPIPPPPIIGCQLLMPEPIEDTLISDSIEEKILPPSIPSSSSHIIICDFSAVTAIRDSINKAKKDSINQVSKTSIETQE